MSLNNYIAVRWITAVTLFLILAASLPANGFTETPLLERTITVALEQERIDIALKKISQQGDFTFSYNPSILESSRLVTFTFAGSTVREVLDKLFEGSVHYKARGNYIILTKTTVSPESNVYSGYVIDEATGRRLKNVSVYDPVSLSSTITDDYGYFQLKVDKPSAADVRLAITKQNYADTVISLPSARGGLLRVPISIDQERLEVLADSVSEKLRRFWKKNILTLQSPNIINIRDTLTRKVQVSVLPFIGTNHRLSGNVINDYSFNVFGGYSLGVEKLEIGGLFNLVRGNVRGPQFAGLFNLVGGKTKASQFAGLINFNLDSVKGAQFAGLINFNWNSANSFSGAGLINFTNGDSRGTHFAGLANLTIGNQRGPHLAGLFNLSTKTSKSVQLSGLWNFAGGGIHGAQGSGLINYGGKEVIGAQITGLINVAPGVVRGAQISGLINYGRYVHGAQVGFLNISDSIQGVPIGFLSFVKTGYHQLELSADEIFYTNLAFRTGIRQFYNILTIGAKPSTFKDEQPSWTFGYGVGTAPRLNRRLSLNFDITANQIVDGGKIETLNLLNKAYAGVEYRPAKHLGLIAGITLNAYMTDVSVSTPELFTSYTPQFIENKTYSNDVNVKMWLGAKVGLRFL